MATSTSMPVKLDNPLAMEKPQGGKRRVMVVADPCRESSGALQWALSHAVLEDDEMILLHVEPSGGSSSSRKGGGLSTYFRRQSIGSMGPSSSFGSVSCGSGSMVLGVGVGGGGGSGEGPAADFLEGMRAECEKAQPKVRVQTERVEMDGKDKAAVILAQTNAFAADLLVVGQRRISTILGCKLGGSISGKPDTAEYLIEKSKCLCIGVQKKGQNSGYLLNTKTHKNFWLLA